MDQAVQTMIDNLYKNTGKSLDQWIEVVKSQTLSKHGEVVKYLKEQHGFTHGFANLVAHKVRESETGATENAADLIARQYRGKEHMKLIYDKLMAEIKSFGKDMEVAPKNTYVSLRRKKQFALVKPATKTRMEVGINLKGKQPQGKLALEKPNAMCSHKIVLTDLTDVDAEVVKWIKLAYDKAG